MTPTFLQPDPYTCVPTSLAYLLHKRDNVSFESILNQLIRESRIRYNLRKDGMEFEHMKEVANQLNIHTTLTNEKPEADMYLTGVYKLPIHKFIGNAIITNAIKAKTLVLSKNYFIYPDSHAVVVSENHGNNYSIFDSFLGLEREIDSKILESCLERPISFLY